MVFTNECLQDHEMLLFSYKKLKLSKKLMSTCIQLHLMMLAWSNLSILENALYKFIIIIIIIIIIFFEVNAEQRLI